MTEFDLVKTIQEEARHLSDDAKENQLKHAQNLQALIKAYIILVSP